MTYEIEPFLVRKLDELRKVSQVPKNKEIWDVIKVSSCSANIYTLKSLGVDPNICPSMDESKKVRMEKGLSNMNRGIIVTTGNDRFNVCNKIMFMALGWSWTSANILSCIHFQALHLIDFYDVRNVRRRKNEQRSELRREPRR